MTAKQGEDDIKVIRIGPGLIALNAVGAAASVYDLLRMAYNSARVTGNPEDLRQVKELINIIESWRDSPNEEERRAYKIFMRNYKKLYKEAKDWLRREKQQAMQ